MLQLIYFYRNKNVSLKKKIIVHFDILNGGIGIKGY